MKVTFEIPESMVENFSDKAKNSLSDCAKGYAYSIIREAEIDEKLYQVQGAAQEITESNVLQAAKTYKTVRKKSGFSKVLRIIGEIGLFVSGILFLPENFVTDSGDLNFPVFFIWLVLTLFSVIITICNHFLGGD